MLFAAAWAFAAFFAAALAIATTRKAAREACKLGPHNCSASQLLGLAALLAPAVLYGKMSARGLLATTHLPWMSHNRCAQQVCKGSLLSLLVSYMTLARLHLENERVCPQERRRERVQRGIVPISPCEEP